MEKPTAQQLMDEDGVKTVLRTVDDGWRHGVDVVEVFHRASDDTYWRACYRRSTDGETNDLRDGEASIEQVKPVEKTITAYEKV